MLDVQEKAKFFVREKLRVVQDSLRLNQSQHQVLRTVTSHASRRNRDTVVKLKIHHSTTTTGQGRARLTRRGLVLRRRWWSVWRAS